MNSLRLHQHWVLAVTVMCYLAMIRWLSIDWALGTPVWLTLTYYQVKKTNPSVTLASALLLSSTFCLNVQIFLMFVRNISQSHRWKTYLIMLLFTTLLLLLRKSIFDYNVVICYLSFSLFRFYIIQIPLLLMLNIVKYFL